MRLKTYILFIIIVGLFVYFNTLFNGFVGDDNLQIVENPNTHSVTNIPRFFSGSTYYTYQGDKPMGVYYRPLMMSLFAVIYQLTGSDPLFFHLVQIVIHIANAILVFLLFKFFLKKNVLSFFFSVIFLVHPINAEAVLYIANTQEVLFFFFGMTAFLLLLRTNKVLTLKRIIVTSFFLLLSLFSKETGVLFIALAIAYTLIFRKEFTKSLLTSWAIIFFIYLFMRYGLAKMQLAQIPIAPLAKASLLERIINIPAIINHYLATFIFPKDLIVADFWIIQNINTANFYLPFLIILALFSAFLILALRLYQQKHKYRKIYIFFFIWFIIGLLLHLQILPLDATVADRWFYFPIIGLLGLIAVVFQLVEIRVRRYKLLVVLLAIIILSGLSLRTFIRTFDWRDSLTLYMHDLKIQQDNFFLQNSIGAELIIAGKYEQAKPYVESSVKAFPYFGNVNNMAAIYLSEGNTEKTREYLQKALTLGDNYLVYQNYSNFLLNYDTPQNAKKFTEEALAKYPQNPKLRQNLTKAQEMLGDVKK